MSGAGSASRPSCTGLGVVDTRRRKRIRHHDHSAALRRMLRLIQLDFRHGYGFLIVPVLIAAGCWYFLVRDQSEVVLWGRASVELSWAFAIIGPVGGAWGAWLAGRDRRSRTETLLESTATPGAVHDVRLLTVPVLGALFAYAGIAAVVIVRTATEATWGGPVWTVIAFGAALIAAYTLVGTIAGILFPARLTPFVAGVGLLLFTTLSYTYVDSNSSYSYLAPFRWVSDVHRYDNVLFHRGSVLVSFAVAFALVAGVVVAALGVLAFARARRPVAVGLGVLAVIILVPSIGTAVEPYSQQTFAFLRGEQSVGPVRNPPLVCAGEVVETCVHKAFQGQLDDVAALADAIVAPVAGLPGVPTRFEQRADVPSAGDTVRYMDTWQWNGADRQWSGAEFVIQDVVVGGLLPSPVWLDSDGHDSRQDRTPAQAAIGQWLVLQAGSGAAVIAPFEFVGVEHPDRGPGYDGRAVGPSFQDEMQAYWDEVERIQIDVNAAAERFAMLSPKDQRAWLETNWDALRAGDLSLEDLP